MASLAPSDHGSKAVLINGVCWFGAFMASLAVATRIYARARLVQAIGKDDYLMIAALVCLSYFLRPIT